MFNKKNNYYNEAPYAAGMNFDIENVKPFLTHLSSSILDLGFSQNEIDTIHSEIDFMKHNEVKKVGTFNVIYKGKPTKIRIETEVHIEPGPKGTVFKEVVLYMYSDPELVKIIDEEMLKTEKS